MTEVFAVPGNSRRTDTVKTKTILAAGIAAPIMMTGIAATPATAMAPASVVVVSKDTNKDFKRKAASKRSSRAAGVAMRTKNTRFSPNTAVRRLEKWAKRGTHGYHNQCLRLADNAYQPKGNRTSTALRQWQRAKKRGYAHPGNRRPPYGAQMFWRTSNPAGHIATYVGNGKAVTNMPGGRVKKINWKKMNSWGRYLGWAEPYYG
ncbi:MAG: hypothetical protein H6524_00665 [Actinobacteria bacterium]|nr:hypothetical protein [Micrococcales bacterium]MCB0903611.1 hypothetical protein [Actinomycetota bacterium]MCO5300401.1 hypothetical protein [Candidatus Nanopelagicales bacterium]MCB9427301.1 hypothetical protein [Actinomycetota bacterium]HPE12377.1 hypothetical protein [Actinomycetota bacterium]